MLDYQKVIEEIAKRENYVYMKKTFNDFVKGVDDPTIFLQVCEYYKIIYRNDLIEILNRYCTLNTQYVKQDVIPRVEEFLFIEGQLRSKGYLIHKFDKDEKVVVLATTISNFGDNTIDTLFPEHTVRRVLLTDLNYMELTYADVSHLDYPLVKFIRICTEGYLAGATDIKFSAAGFEDNSAYPIRFRLGNNLVPNSLYEMDAKSNAKLIQRVAERYAISPTMLNSSEGDKFSIKNVFGFNGISLRIATIKTISGFIYSARPLGDSKLVAEIKSLGFHPRVNSVIERMNRTTSGLNLVTGPLRAGKSTTILSAMHQLIKRPIQVLEISSPVETPLPIDSIEYNTEEELMNITSIVKKLDVNVVSLNEIPNPRIAKSVYDLLNSSIVVYSTFHISRIWHLFYKISEYFGGEVNNIVPYLKYVVNQKAFVKQCVECLDKKIITDYSSTEGIFPEVLDYMKEHGINSYYESRGCPECNHTGVLKGIRPYAEFVVFDDELRRKITRCSKLYEIEDLLREKVKSDKSSLEYFINKDVADGILHPNQILEIL